MYYLAEGQAEVVIMGTVDAASKQGTGCSIRSPPDMHILPPSLVHMLPPRHAAASQRSLQLRQPPLSR